MGINRGVSAKARVQMSTYSFEYVLIYSFEYSRTQKCKRSLSSVFVRGNVRRMSRKPTRKKKLDLDAPPPKPSTKRVNFDVAASLHWKMRLRVMELESEGKVSNYKEYLTSLLEADLEKSERRVR